MKKIMLAVLLLLPVGCCAADKQAAREIDATHGIMFPRYLKLAEADIKAGAGSPEEKAAKIDDEKKLVESLDRLTKKLVKSVE